MAVFVDDDDLQAAVFVDEYDYDEEEETFKWQFLTTWLHLSHSGGVPSIENFRFLSIF